MSMFEYDDVDNIDEDNIDLNLDELFKKKQMRDKLKYETFNRLLQRAVKKVKQTSTLCPDDQCCFFVVPEDIVGETQYDQQQAINFIIEKLTAKNLAVKFFKPNLLFISWKHWIPEYIRHEIYKKTGIKVDGNGQQLGLSVEPQTNESVQPIVEQEKINPFKSTKEYVPDNNLIYNEDLVKIIESKIYTP